MTREQRGASFRSDELFRLVAEKVEDFAVFAVELDGIAASWNPGVEKLLGYTEDEFVGLDSCVIFTPEDIERGECVREMRAAAADGRAEDRRWHVRKDGTLFWASGLLMALNDEAGALRGFAKILRDETAHKQMEDRLRDSEAFGRNILESISDAFYALDREWRFTYLNRQCEPIIGRKREDLIGKSIWKEFPESIHSMFYEQYHRAVAEGIAITFEAYYAPFDSWFEIHAYPSTEGLSVYFHDINQRKQAEKLLQESEERYRSLFASIDEGFCVIEMQFDERGVPVDYRFLELNPAFEKQTGIPAGEALSGKTVRQLLPNLEAHWFETYGRVALTGEPVRFVSGSDVMNRWFDVYAFRVGRPEDHRVALLFNNITERRRTENALRQSQERLRMAMEAAQIYSWEMNLMTQQVEWSENLERVIGFSLPTDFATLINFVHAEDREATARQILAAAAGDHVYESEFRLVNPSSGEVVWVCGQGVLAKSASDDEQQSFVGITQNITGRKRAERERERLLSEAQEANRLKDEFLATLSHELRTPLTSILGWSRLLQMSNFDETARARALSTIERNAQAQSQLIDDLLDTSRIITGKLRLDVRPVDLASVVTAATETARPAAEAKEISLQTILDTQTSPISGDPDRLQQVVWNLLSNAIKFTPKGGRVQVRLERVNSHVEITVADTGRGIAAEFLPHVFDRFRQADQTTTRTHGGLGLGLAIVRQLVELHGGSVHVESGGEGSGTSFTVSLPLLPLRQQEERANDVARIQPAAQEGNVELDCPPELAGLRVLVVDDEPDTRELLAAVLDSCGAQVIQAATAAEAFEQVEHARADVLVTDIGMPGEDGYSLLARIRALPRERGGRIPAAALTAYARAEDRVRALRAGFQTHMTKPVEPAELITVVANLAGRTGGRVKHEG
ncbi:MAG TPA: PAS domain S-box protein [Pyrinomonadaceae bacterium]|jgi:PAS domain S-box-containing protein|nr:PAS domain S-box protein [Pyrinomonadaceae bacterium]